MLRLEGRLFFLNAERIRGKDPLADRGGKAQGGLLDLSGVFDLEYSALKMLMEAEKRNREGGVTLLARGTRAGRVCHDPALAPGRGAGA